MLKKFHLTWVTNGGGEAKMESGNTFNVLFVNPSLSLYYNQTGEVDTVPKEVCISSSGRVASRRICAQPAKQACSDKFHHFLFPDPALKLTKLLKQCITLRKHVMINRPVVG